MPVNKPTISHQLKTVITNRSRTGNIIHTAPNIISNSSQTRSHLKSSEPKWKRSCYENRDELDDIGDISKLELRQCTRILKNVLANEENKSTSTEDGDFDVVKHRSVGFKTSDSAEGERFSQHSDGAGEITEAESLTSVADHKTTLASNTHVSSSQPLPQHKLCTCLIDRDTGGSMHDSRRLSVVSDCSKSYGDRLAICTRCHNAIPPNKDVDTANNKSKTFAQTYGEERFSENSNTKTTHSPIAVTEFKNTLHHDSFGDENFDHLASLLQVKLGEISLIARATRDADLDRLVSEIDRLLQQKTKENSALFEHLKTIAKTLKWENSGLKGKVKSQSESNHDIKSELRLLRQDKKQKIEELKLELQLKGEEVRQLTERDQSSVNHWRDKYHHLEKEHEKMRSDLQGQVLQSCQKDTEIIQVKHLCTQSESKLKEHIHSLMLANQNLQTELCKAQEANRRHEQECQHNQTIIKAAREHVVNLLERHRHDREGTLGSRFDQLYDGSPNAAGDWINQAASIQQVLSLVSDNGQKPVSTDTHHRHSFDFSANLLHSSAYDQSPSTAVSPINFATTNYNNNYSSSCNQNGSKHSEGNVVLMKAGYRSSRNRDHSRSPSDVSSTISHNGSEYSLTNAPTAGQVIVDVDYKCGDLHDSPWHLDMPTKAKFSSTSSVMSTVSSLRSTDDREFRNGLQRLDSQINKLQTTLQSKLQCKQ